MSTKSKQFAADKTSDPSLPRDIAVFIDGTWNQADTTATNVRKIFEATLEGVQQGRLQSKLYVSGVGAMPKVDLGRNGDTDYERALDWLLRQEMPFGLATLRRRLVGGSFGKGTAARIQASATEFLSCSFI